MRIVTSGPISSYFGIIPQQGSADRGFLQRDEICRIIGTDSLEYGAMDGLLKTVETVAVISVWDVLAGIPVEME